MAKLAVNDWGKCFFCGEKIAEIATYDITDRVIYCVLKHPIIIQYRKGGRFQFSVHVNEKEYTVLRSPNKTILSTRHLWEHKILLEWSEFPAGLTPENAEDKIRGWLNWL